MLLGFSEGGNGRVKINEKGLKIIKESEGKRLVAFLCPAGIWTIGWGHTGKDVHEGMEITDQKADLLLKEDLEWAERTVKKMVKVPLNENQFSALVSFVFNVGSGNFESSTLLRKLNALDYDGASLQFTRWIYSKGKALTGLAIRREKERSLFEAS